MYKLYYYPGNASMAPHMMLRELEANFELLLVDRKTEAQKDAAYLKLNPSGRIPTLIDGDLVLFESAAICLYLAEKHPGSDLVPPEGSAARALFLQWLFYLTTTWQPEMMINSYPEKHTTDPTGTDAVVAAQQIRLAEIMTLLDKELAGKTFLVGDSLTVCDLFLLMLSIWTTHLDKPWHTYQNLAACVRSLVRRPAITLALEVEGMSNELFA